MMSKIKSVSSRGLGIHATTVAVCIALLAMPMAAWAIPAFTGGTGAMSFGVTNYGGGPVAGPPTYNILNNVTGRFDIMTSPATGVFQTANPVIANNIASYGLLPIPPAWSAWQVGGGNINGPFGFGQLAETGTAYGFRLSDPVAGCCSASYELGSMISTFTNPVAYAGRYGSYLAVAGRLPAINADGAVALRSFASSANPLSPFFGGVDLPQLVLAAVRTGPLAYSTVQYGGSGAIVQITNPFTGFFRGLAVNNLALPGPGVIPAGDVITVRSTLTVYADPMHMDMLDPGDVTDLFSLLDVSLPDWTVGGSFQVPEPATGMLLLIGATMLGGRRRRHA